MNPQLYHLVTYDLWQLTYPFCAFSYTGMILIIIFGSYEKPCGAEGAAMASSGADVKTYFVWANGLLKCQTTWERLA